jgi:hypothetical protein
LSYSLIGKFADGNNYTLVAKPEYYSTIAKIISSKSSDHLQYWRYSVKPMGMQCGVD